MKLQKTNFFASRLNERLFSRLGYDKHFSRIAMTTRFSYDTFSYVAAKTNISPMITLKMNYSIKMKYIFSSTVLNRSKYSHHSKTPGYCHKGIHGKEEYAAAPRVNQGGSTARPGGAARFRWARRGGALDFRLLSALAAAGTGHSMRRAMPMPRPLSE